MITIIITLILNVYTITPHYLYPQLSIKNRLPLSYPPKTEPHKLTLRLTDAISANGLIKALADHNAADDPDVQLAFLF